MLDPKRVVLVGLLLALVASPSPAPIDKRIPPVVIQGIMPPSAAPGATVRIGFTSLQSPLPGTVAVTFDRAQAKVSAIVIEGERRYTLDTVVPSGISPGIVSVQVTIGSLKASEPRSFLVAAPPRAPEWYTRTFEAVLIAVLVGVTALLGWLIWRFFSRFVVSPPQAPMAQKPEAFSPLVTPDGLVEAFLAGECVVYVGAGLSAASGYPAWFNLVSEILDWAIDKDYVEREFGESLRAALQEGNADLVADSVVGRLGGREDRLHAHLSEMFLDSERPLAAAHRLLRDLPFCAALTTNFDELLEHTFERERPPVFTPEDTDKLLEALASRTFFLLKLYGSLRNPATLLLSPAQYQEAIAGNRAFVQAMESLFFSRTIFFVGASLAGIESYLGGLAFRGIARRRHYALVGVTGNAWQAQADLLDRRYGIQVLAYRISTPSHPEVIDFLSGLRERVRAEIKLRSRRRPSPELMSRSTALTRVRLENVGPFQELDLELDPRWSLLLGDNGVGKSTVLKAIATAICGKDAEPFAGQLIHTTSRVARIVLSFGPNEYMATLVSRDGGQADIEVAPSRPLETEGWLAIAFPPLRTVSWSRPQGPGPEGKRRPTTEDLLPLLKGGIDPRLDELKQWLVNLDYWSKSEPAKTRGRYARLRDELFELANSLAEGVPLRFKRVDEFTHQVTVETEDGEVPIEAVSQGTASLVGWTGFLLQRLHEVYGQQEGDPRRRYALVLLDEIDAHMHPSWQQTLVERLSEAFPGVQFVASTHSPLIAGSLAPCSIFRFRREGGRVIAEQPPTSFKGWRVDQILTSPLFDLQTGRESETERLLLRYSELAARDHLEPKEEEEMKAAAEALKIRMPTHAERREAQAAYDVLESALRDRLQEMSLEERERILAEAKLQLQEALTGSRRPD